MNVKDVQSHIKEVHKSVKWHADTGRAVTLFCPGGGPKLADLTCSVYQDHPVFFVVQKNKDVVHAWISILGDEEVADKYVASITVAGNRFKMEALGRPVYPIDSSREEVFGKVGRHLQLAQSNVRDLVFGYRHRRARIQISYKIKAK